MTKSGTVLSNASPLAQNLYGSLLATLGQLGPFEEELKKTSIHLVRRSAFAGIQMRREYLILTIKSEKPIASTRIAKDEQASRNRWHSEIKIASAAELDAELLTWLKVAYDLCA
jgi:hypothetical protein